MAENDSRNHEDGGVAVENRDSIYDSEGHIRSDFRKTVGRALDNGNIDHLNGLVASLHESEMGDLLESLKPKRRRKLVETLGESFDFAALTEVDEAIRVEIVENIPNEEIARAIGELDSDDAVFILEGLEQTDRDAILAELPFIERVRLRRSLEYPEDTAGRRMQSEFVAVPPFWTVGQTIDYMRNEDGLPEHFSQIFVIDATYKLVGSIDLDKILRTPRLTPTELIMNDTVHPIPALMDQEEAASVFEQYDLLSAAVVDEDERLVGVLTIDDVVDVIQEEAEEDIKALGGVGDEELSDSVIATFRSRVAWLFVNLVTAIAASMVIGIFDATIEQMVALAVLMPIVASMGGNAGTQTMTVTVRALATRDLDIYNAGRIIRREAAVGAINGLLFATLIGLVAAIWFQNIDLGFVIGIAMIINMISAALAGILLPLMLDKFGVDPAISSTVFVTTVTDVIGFLPFLVLRVGGSNSYNAVMVTLFTITQLTKEFNISTRTLRFYEDEGLIRPERRGRTRLYTIADRNRIDKILCARRVGFSVAEISEMLKLQSELPDNTRQLRAVMDRIEKKRNDLRQQRRDLEMVVDDLDNLEDSCLAKLAEISVRT